MFVLLNSTHCRSTKRYGLGLFLSLKPVLVLLAIWGPFHLAFVFAFAYHLMTCIHSSVRWHILEVKNKTKTKTKTKTKHKINKMLLFLLFGLSISARSSARTKMLPRPFG